MAGIEIRIGAVKNITASGLFSTDTRSFKVKMSHKECPLEEKVYLICVYA